MDFSCGGLPLFLRGMLTISMVEMVFKKKRAWVNTVGLALVVCLTAGAAGPALGQAPTSGPKTNSSTNITNSLGDAVQAEQQLAQPGPSVTPQASTAGSVDPSYHGSL